MKTPMPGCLGKIESAIMSYENKFTGALSNERLPGKIGSAHHERPIWIWAVLGK